MLNTLKIFENQKSIEYLLNIYEILIILIKFSSVNRTTVIIYFIMKSYQLIWLICSLF